MHSYFTYTSKPLNKTLVISTLTLFVVEMMIGSFAPILTNNRSNDYKKSSENSKMTEEPNFFLFSKCLIE